MQLGSFLASLLLWLFCVAAFPEMENACRNATGSGLMLSVIQHLPLIFLVCLAVLPIYFGVSKKQ